MKERVEDERGRKGRSRNINPKGNNDDPKIVDPTFLPNPLLHPSFASVFARSAISVHKSSSATVYDTRGMTITPHVPTDKLHVTVVYESRDGGRHATLSCDGIVDADIHRCSCWRR